LVYLTAREACLNACQQWVTLTLLKQMGYKLLLSADPHFVDAPRTEESKQLTQKLKIVKQHARNADYCDFTEGVSEECLKVFNDIKTKNISTDEATATRLANQMRCLTAGFAAGLNP
jgi:hypothetical protein